MTRTSQDAGPARFSSRMRTAATNKARLPWRNRTKHKTYQRTSVEKKALAEKRRNNKKSYHEALAAAYAAVQEEAVKLKEQFGAHSVQYYMEEIMQQSRLTKHKRSVNSWNVYLRNEVKRINDGESDLLSLVLYICTQILVTVARPSGEPRQKASALTGQISAQWRSMSKEEQEAITRDGCEDLKDHREMKAVSTRTVPIHVFHDARRTLELLEKEVSHSHGESQYVIKQSSADPCCPCSDRP